MNILTGILYLLCIIICVLLIWFVSAMAIIGANYINDKHNMKSSKLVYNLLHVAVILIGIGMIAIPYIL